MILVTFLWRGGLELLKKLNRGEEREVHSTGLTTISIQKSNDRDQNVFIGNIPRMLCPLYRVAFVGETQYG